MNELQMIHLLNVIVAFLIGAAIGMALMMVNYGFFHRAVEVLRQKKRAARGMATRNKRKKTCVSDVEDTDQKPPAYNDLDFILDVEAANPHKLYDVIYMCDTQGEVLATDLSYGDAQATVRCFAEGMHEELIADLIIRETRDDKA